MLSQRLDQLVFVHLRATVDLELSGAILELVDGPFLVRRVASAPLAGCLAVGVGDPRRLLLARALLAERFVLLVVFDLRTVVVSHLCCLSIVAIRDRRSPTVGEGNTA